MRGWDVHARGALLIGKHFGRLRVTRLATRAKDRHIRYWCVCECGRISCPSGSQLRSGKTTSCGCYGQSLTKRHGLAHTKTYRAWAALKQRCLNSKHVAYHRYGGRGIRVCERWLASFDNFLSDMGISPPGLTIERINNDGDYEPGNCKWASRKEQAINRSTTRVR